MLRSDPIKRMIVGFYAVYSRICFLQKMKQLQCMHHSMGWSASAEYR